MDTQQKKEYANALMILLAAEKQRCDEETARDFFEKCGFSIALGGTEDFTKAWEDHSTWTGKNPDKEYGGVWSHNTDPNWERHWYRQMIPDGRILMMLMFPSDVLSEVYLAITGHNKPWQLDRDYGQVEACPGLSSSFNDATFMVQTFDFP